MFNIPLRDNIQTVIHQLEAGFGPRLLRYFLLFLVVFCLVVLYDLRDYQNRFTPEGMDAAQLARNIAAGKGYTTEFIRPFSLYLVQAYNQRLAPNSLISQNLDFARAQNHPDLANPPVYPFVLAGLMKVLPLHLRSAFWADGGESARYKPDLLITLLNQVLLITVAVTIFFLGRKLFDQRVAWTSAVLTIGCATLWRFSTSGLSTLLLLLIFLGLTWCMVKIEELGREPQPVAHLTGWVIATGVLVGMGALTRYSFGFLVVPVVAFLFLFSGPRRAAYVLIVLTIFAVILTPWCIRNYSICGEPFGVAGFSAMEDTIIYPQFLLERSIHPNFFGFILRPYFVKMADNLRAICSNDLPTLGGCWATLFFLAGLMLVFRKVGAQRLRYFLLMCLGTSILVQSLGRTALSAESPVINSENLLILFAPLVFVYGASFFWTLLDQWELPLIELRYPIIGAFVILSSVPLIFSLWAPSPVAYPPYLLSNIQRFAGWMQPDEWTMSDVPWAVAWYGNRQCVWLSGDANTDFFQINNNVKTVNALYLTGETMNQNFINYWNNSDDSWETFIREAVIQKKIPANFPLNKAPAGFFPESLFLADKIRWQAAK
jgi:4-amino-4-deoxy-L-arabinose transferase-like glycosyltransferase